ncbi:DUF4007 family protein [Kallotenue papyrolyticum]|uniref:DUF4007 family protein n=1 Tax=Kallotenue papyrolyticum TaxID=1325125 RepID=UPI000478573E|nr:DUF4007 family protein [Kallotenue papyrolyticum]
MAHLNLRSDEQHSAPVAPAVERSVPQRYGFAGHETFPFRYGWLTKAVAGVREDPLIFTREAAIVRLGVGKNMVASIRHWGLATRLLAEQGTGGLTVTPLGALLLEQGDPFLEDPASLWIIHWLLATNPSRAATWWLALARYPQPDFTKTRLVRYIVEFAERHGLRVKESTVIRDVDCFVRTYLPSRTASKRLIEDSFDCPLVELGLIQPTPDGEHFQFNIGPKPGLPAAVVAFALCEYWARTRPERQTLAFNDALYGEASPGQVFKLDENTLMAYAEAWPELTDGRLQLDETAGLKQFYRSAPIDAMELLARYYADRSIA